jgi:histidyl-tRNA synthetase
MSSFGAKDDDFEIRINSEETFNLIPEYTSIPAETCKKFFKLLDKKLKIPREEYLAKRSEIFNNDSEIAEIFETKQLREFARDLGAGKIGGDSSKKMNEIIKRLPGKIVIEPWLTRGFDYYTGIIF